MIELSEIIEYKELISDIPVNKIKILEELVSKAKLNNLNKNKHNRITLPHLINLLVRQEEYSNEHNELLAILQKKMRDFDKKGSNLYIQFS